MRASTAFLWIFAIFSGIVIAVKGGSQLAHNYEAIYFYYGYLADVAINGDLHTLGTKCIPKSGTVCTFWEFIHSIMKQFDAATLLMDNELGPTTRPGDLQELADAMTEWGYTKYIHQNLVSDGERRHTKLLLRATNILINARDNHPTVLAGGLLAQAKKALVYAHAERGQDNLEDKKNAFVEAYGSNLVIVERTVKLEDELISFQDIDWQQSAVQTAKRYGRSEQDQLDSFVDFAQHLTVNTDIEQNIRDHIMIIQSIRTQSDSLGSLESCRAIG